MGYENQTYKHSYNRMRNIAVASALAFVGVSGCSDPTPQATEQTVQLADFSDEQGMSYVVEKIYPEVKDLVRENEKINSHISTLTPEINGVSSRVFIINASTRNVDYETIKLYVQALYSMRNDLQDSFLPRPNEEPITQPTHNVTDQVIIFGDLYEMDAVPQQAKDFFKTKGSHLNVAPYLFDESTGVNYVQTPRREDSHSEFSELYMDEWTTSSLVHSLCRNILKGSVQEKDMCTSVTKAVENIFGGIPYDEYLVQAQQDGSSFMLNANMFLTLRGIAESKSIFKEFVPAENATTAY